MPSESSPRLPETQRSDGPTAPAAAVPGKPAPPPPPKRRSRWRQAPLLVAGLVLAYARRGVGRIAHERIPNDPAANIREYHVSRAHRAQLKILLVPQRHQRIDARRLARGDVAGHG